MADGLHGVKLRPAEMLAKPVRVDPAFSNPDHVVQLCRDSGPYRLASAVHKMAPTGKDLPWFRVFWGAGGMVLDERANSLFFNEAFIEGAKESFGAKVVKPISLMNNVNAPMPAGIPHLDLAKFRGGERFPFDLLVAMAYSNLFHDWAVPQASAISWFYRGEGGDFDYWPDGPEGGVQSVNAPLWNVGYVSDNEYMWHRISGIGPADQYFTPGEISRETMLHADESGGGWTMIDGDSQRRFSENEIRLSVLWKALAFENEQAYQRYLNKEHDLTIPQVLIILNEDLKHRGLQPLPDDCDFSRHEDLRYIRKAYPAPRLKDA